ncbi:oligosaccharide flippase family protein [Cytophagales bacterium LB-30]|uniref:Oligosaccharide flippase family protein n=1 Tax=Shiella aurantiaca TaxID=3058365 RepID=A0ABT8F3U7_9BACT|nr:oligosaccharide flippase family protein [Shiella aurantiaca]MDN4164919.1 oligosaccharide flippase family protein [Shiella aurantiaca]
MHKPMGLVIRQSIVSTTLSYLGVAIGYLNMLWWFPAVLSEAELGLWRFIQDTALLLVPFAQIGLAQGILRFFPAHHKEKGFFSFILATTLIFFGIFLGVFMLIKPWFMGLFADNAQEVNQYLSLLLICALLLTLVSIMEAFCRSHLQVIIPTLVKEVFFRIFSSISIALYFFQVIPFQGLLYFLVITYATGFLFMFFYLVMKKNTHFSFHWDFVDTPFVRRFFSYILLTMLGSSGILILSRIDSFMVTSYLGLAENAIYTIAFFIATVLEMPKRGITQITTPLISQSFLKNDLKEVESLYKKVSIHQAVIGLLLFIGIISNLDSLYHFVPNGEVYQTGKRVVIIIALGKLADMIAGVNGEIIVMSKYYMFNIVLVAALAIFTIGLNIYLIPLYGLEGAALSFCLAIIAFNTLKIGFIYLKYQIHPFSSKTFPLVLGAIAIYALVYLLPFPSEWHLANLIIKSALITLLYTLFIYRLNPSYEIRQLFLKAFQRLGFK